MPPSAKALEKNSTDSEILGSFDKKLPIYHAFEAGTKETIKKLLEARGLKVHSVDGRVKDRKKLQEKINRAGKSYEDLTAVKDIVGIRVITYFDDEIDLIAKLIEEEFELIPEHCVDKRKSLEPNEFGYLSLHYVCKWKANRLALTENKVFTGHEFEIQIRSLLQHTWAEIEHDLGYKAGSEIPPAIRRRFSQLAGLLEVADREFREVRETLATYVAEIRNNLRTAESNTPIDSISLGVFFSESRLVNELDRWLCDWFDSLLLDGVDSRDTDTVLSMLQLCGIITIEQLERCIRLNRDSFFVYMKGRFPRVPDDDDDEPGLYTKGSSVYLLAHPLALAAGGPAKLRDLLTKCVGYVDNEDVLAQAIQEISNCAAGLEWQL